MLPQTQQTPIVYPDSDGQPMADNTKQFDLISSIKGELSIIFKEQPDVFIAGDLLWYPLEGHPEIRVAPDALVVFGRPKGYRGSYRQWEEENIAPQVVLEVLSPGNRPEEMARKLEFYERYGVEEYYILDPDRVDIVGYLGNNTRLTLVNDISTWKSPRLGIRFGTDDGEVMLYRPDGRAFVRFEEIGRLHEEALELLKTERKNVLMERKRTEEERKRAEAEHLRSERLAAQLRALGIEPDTT